MNRQIRRVDRQTHSSNPKACAPRVNNPLDVDAHDEHSNVPYDVRQAVAGGHGTKLLSSPKAPTSQSPQPSSMLVKQHNSLVHMDIHQEEASTLSLHDQAKVVQYVHILHTDTAAAAGPYAAMT